jgi:putative component of toxin-antitoxin plasmid stabilization module|tara:strand:- start:144 stop:263 length:120 start_codon:yes stop_codon:yes gene_type:complete
MDKYSAWLFGDYEFTEEEIKELRKKASKKYKRYYNKQKE